MSVMVSVLEELETRAGASDQQREAWLSDRRAGVTATELRDLYMKRVTIGELVNRKLGRVPEVGDLSHIPVIGWGRLREPIIAALVEQRFGIRPESRVFRAADESRFLASPDGVGINFDEELLISEIKTSGKDIPPWSDAYADKGYEIQQQWGMRVLGAIRSLFVWEIRDELPGGAFVNGRLQHAWVDRDDVLIGKLEKLARQFLAALDKAAAEPYVAPLIDEELDTHAVNYLRGLDLERQAKALKAPAWAALLAAGKSQTSLVARVTFTPGEAGEVEEIDYAAAEAADPDLFARMKAAAVAWAAHCEGFKRTVPVPGKPRLTVTAVKQKTVEEQE